MANSKQINELNPATQVNDTDLLAVAQEGESQAVRATVSQLADAIAELNESGAMRELILSTSIGKNLLAQRLTEKGATSTASDTLIQMSDKLNRLNIADEYNILVGKCKVTSMSAGYLSSIEPEINSTKCATAQLNDEYGVLLSNNTLYVYKIFEDYSSIADIRLKATITQALTNQLDNSLYPVLSCLQDGSGIIVGGIEANKFDLYDVDITNLSVTFDKTYTITDCAYSSSGHGNSVYMNNARNLVFAKNDSSYVNTLYLLDTDGSVLSSISMSESDKCGKCVYFSEDENAVYIDTLFSDSNYVVKTTKWVYSISGSTISTVSISPLYPTGTYYTYGGLTRYGISITGSTSRKLYDKVYVYTSAIEVKDLPENQDTSIEVSYMCSADVNGSDAAQTRLPNFGSPVIVNTEQDKFDIYIGTAVLEYNRSNNTVVCKSCVMYELHSTVGYVFGDYNDATAYPLCIPKTKDGKYISVNAALTSASGNYAVDNNSARVLEYAIDDTPLCYGLATTFNGTLNYILQNKFGTGSTDPFNPNTTRIELVEDN